PAPFDFMVIILIGVWLLSGLHIPRSFTLPLCLLGMMTMGGLVAALFSDTMIPSGRHVIISIFLYILTVGLGAFIARDPRTALPTVMNGYMVAATIATVAGIIGYFSLIDGAHDLFTFRERARGTFKDPNVFGPFLVVPIVYGFLSHLTGKERLGGLQTGLLVLLGLGILLSFSRGAWVNLVMSTSIATYLLFVSVRSNGLRLKVIGLTAVLGLSGAALVVFALSFDAIADLMSVRGQLIQSYDTDERFAGAGIALDVILNNPFGIGSASFENFHNAEPHNVYLYMFLISGWVGGFAFICLVLYTLYAGLRCALQDGPMRFFSIVLFSTFLALSLEGLIVDIDHWRHFYVLMACIWGVDSYLLRARHNGKAEVGTLKRVRKIPGLTERLTAQPRGPLLKNPAIGTKPGTIAPRQAKTNKPAKLRTLREKYPAVLSEPHLTANQPERSAFGTRNPGMSPERTAFGRRQGV
ncbi:MAG: O-antigen ligase family protein, partial [Hyphomicrobiaceae bacterium]